MKEGRRGRRERKRKAELVNNEERAVRHTYKALFV